MPARGWGTASIVLGALLALSAAGSFSSGAMSPREQSLHGPSEEIATTFKEIEKVRDELRPITVTIASFKLAFAFSLIALGIGLYRPGPAAIRAGIVWSSLALVDVAVDAWVQATIVSPRMLLAEQHFVAGMTQAASMPAKIPIDGILEGVRWFSIFGGAFFAGLYPLILLIVLLRARGAPPQGAA